MAKVYVVHCIDTEGPLYEPLVETFERIHRITGVEVPPSLENLKKIQAGEYPLNGHEKMAQMAFSARFLDYNATWTELEEMLKAITREEFRNAHADSFGNGWRYTYFVNDFVDFLVNPRERCMGYHAIWDHYQNFYRVYVRQKIDEFQWHTHGMTFSKEAHRNAISLFHSPHVFEVLARRVIDKCVFPECFRAGFNAERPDWNWFLEQYIPYDFSNQAMSLSQFDREQGLSTGRFGDWRHAPKTWNPYHPSHDDYQVPGDCRRWIFRCLNVGTRIRVMQQEDVDQAFSCAAEGTDVVLAFMDHDFRNILPDIEETYTMIKKSAEKYPGVVWESTTASRAARAVTGYGIVFSEEDLLVSLSENKLEVRVPHKSFGPQPFLAIKTWGGRYLTDDFDFEDPFFRWSYTFDENTIPLQDVSLIGVATNAAGGGGSLPLECGWSYCR